MPIPAPRHPYRTSPNQRVTRVTPSDDTWIPVVRMADDSWKDFYFMNLGFANDKDGGTAGDNTANPWVPASKTESFGVPNPATSELSQPAGSHWRVSQNPQPVGADKHITLWKSGELELVDTTGDATAIYNTSGSPYTPTFSGIGLRLAAQSSTSTGGVEIVPRTVYPPAESPSNVGEMTWRTPEVAGMIQGAGGGVPVGDASTEILLGHYTYKPVAPYSGGGTYFDRMWMSSGVKNTGPNWQRAVRSGIQDTVIPGSGQPLTFPASSRIQPTGKFKQQTYEWVVEIPQENSFFPQGAINVQMYLRGPQGASAQWVPGNDGWSPFAGIHNHDTAGSTCTSAVITNWQYRWMKYRGLSP